MHAVEVSERDEYVRALWRRVRPAIQQAVGTLALNELERLAPAELDQLDEILEQKVPELRRLTSHSAPSTGVDETAE